MGEFAALDRAWLAAHPLAVIPTDTNKNERGRVLVVGGSRLSPGALVLTGEAALRAGAGKVRLATIACLTEPLGMRVPEAGLIALPEGSAGEIEPSAAELLRDEFMHSDCVIIGPGMTDANAAEALLRTAIAVMTADQALVIDAAAINAAAACFAPLREANVRAILTPHMGEMAKLLGRDRDSVDADQTGALERAVASSGQVVVLKSPSTSIGDPGGARLTYGGGGPGLATGGSGDVLAGIIGGLAASGQDALAAAAWGVWLHGEAGARLAAEQGPVGYLARELVPLVPMLKRNLR